ncbi:glycosyltransferase WbuB, partial [Vibrio parahaemolyticus]
MKIIYLHQYFKKPSMNGGVRSYEFAKRLVLDGHHVIMVTSDTENKFKGWKIEFVDGIEVHWVSVPYSNNLNFWGRILAFLKFIVLASLHL